MPGSPKLVPRARALLGLRKGRSSETDKPPDWEKLWRQEADRPDALLSREVPAELIDAVQDGWFPAGVEVFDIGSGRGQISAWLALRGFRVLGGELSEAGTKLARKHFGHLEGIRFETVDICAFEPEAGRFGALVDRGCYHGIPSELRGTYARNIATAAAPGAPYLLLAAEDLVGDEVPAMFESWFTVERSAPTIEPMKRSSGPIPRKTKPGRAYWMRRRAGEGCARQEDR